MPRASLSEQRQKLEAKLKAIKDQEEAEANRRLLVAGRAVLAHAEQDDAFRHELQRILATHVKKQRDRALFGLDGAAPREQDRAPSDSPQ